jgi:transcriptional regulator with XRE-family HTH domain
MRVRLRRRGLGMTQDALAEFLGLTFQQVQKYERGANRISASKLQVIASALDVPIAYFFEGLPGQPSAQASENAVSPMDDFFALPDAQDFLEVLPRTSPRVRQRLLELARSLER